MSESVVAETSILREFAKRIPGAVPIVQSLRRLLLPPIPEPLISFKPTYNEDNLATDHWLTTDARFVSAFKRSVDLGIHVSSEIRWRTHVVCWAARVASQLDGVFVECGVNRGFYSRVIIDYLDSVPDFYLLDTFKGFDERTLSKAQADGLKAWHARSGRTGDWQQGMYDECYAEVVKTFADKPQVKIIRGTVPDTLPQVTADKIAYLSIDMNCAMPEIAAIEYFWPKMVRGGIAVLDDYGWPGHDEQREAWDEWSRRNTVPLMSLPTGQGMIIKT